MKNKFMLLIMLLISTPITVHAGLEGYPVFSWNKVPLYGHFTIDSGYTPEEYQTLADKFSIITFTAGSIPRNKTAEDMIKEGAEGVKEYNSDAKILFMWSATYYKKKWRKTNSGYPTNSNYMYLPPKSENHDEMWFYDITDPAVRTWWAEKAATSLSLWSCDGIFADGAANPLRENATMHDAYKIYIDDPNADINDLRTAIKLMLGEARDKLAAIRNDFIVSFNGIQPQKGNQPAFGQQFLVASDPIANGDAVADVGFHEKFWHNEDQTPDFLLDSLIMMEDIANEGKIVTLKAWPNFTWQADWVKAAEEVKDQRLPGPDDDYQDLVELAKKRITFPLAAFLAFAQENCYFAYSWGYRASQGPLIDYPEYDHDLGNPVEERQQLGPYEFSRKFQHAEVWVNLETEEASINWDYEHFRNGRTRP